MRLFKIVKKSLFKFKDLKDKQKKRRERQEMTTKNLISNSFIQGYIGLLNTKEVKRWPNLSEDKRRDYEALKGDWKNVGREIEEGTRRFNDVGRCKNEGGREC